MKNTQRKRPRFGDVIEISTRRGLAYAQYTHRHIEPPRYGALIRVLPGLYSSRPQEFSALVKDREQFLVFFPLGAACNRGLVKIVAHESIPEHARPFPLFRADSSMTDCWLWDGHREWRIGELTETQRDLPIRKGVNDTMLIHMIETSWSARNQA